MRMWQWTQGLSKMREADRIDCEERVSKILQDEETTPKRIDDYPKISEYLHDKFPDIDVSDVSIYIASANAMHAAGWSHAGGLYVHHMSLILVKRALSSRKRSRGRKKKKKNEFDQLLDKTIDNKLQVEDILVHELIHAVSGRANRASRKFVNQEEEFVFTNCIDLYKQKGMTDFDIATEVFLPFCVQNVLQDGKTLIKILSQHNCIPPDTGSMEALRNPYGLLNRHKDVIVSKVVEKAKKNALLMIDLYNRYGSKTYFVSEAPLMDNKLKFASIDLD